VVYLCDLQNHMRVLPLWTAMTNVESLVFSPDGKHLLAGSRYEDVCWLSLQDLESKQIALAVSMGTGPYFGLALQLLEHRLVCSSRVESLEFLAGSSQILVPNRRPAKDRARAGFVQLVDAGLKSVIKELDASTNDQEGRLVVARPSPCGRYVAAGEGARSRCFIFELASGE
jgi:hypothetical protein